MPSLKEYHPLYTDKLAQWEKMAHCYEGEDRVKEEGTTYLPATLGMIRAGGANENDLKATPNSKTAGGLAYEAYKMRAKFPGYVAQAVKKLNGIIHRERWNVELPRQIEGMIERASVEGENVHELARRITFHQLREGRYGLLTDLPSNISAAEALPYIAGYVAPSIINWRQIDRRDGTHRLGLVVLDESGYEQAESLRWQWVDRYRVLAIDRALDMLGVVEGEGGVGNRALYHSGFVAGSHESADLSWVVPQATEALTDLPFVFVGTNDLAIDPGKPPLLELANECLAIYRGEADLRQTLYLQGQATLVLTGVSEDEAEGQHALGAGGKMAFSSDQAKAEFVAAPATGISEQRAALEADHMRAQNESTQLLGSKSGQAESGVALQIRQAGATASLSQLAKTAAEGLKRSLQHAALFMGGDPAEVVVEPNLEFIRDVATTQEAKELWKIVQDGGLSRESWHRYAQRHDLTEKSFEEEQELIREDQEEWPSGSGNNIDAFAMQ